jgi:hypothetical protein
MSDGLKPLSAALQGPLAHLESRARDASKLLELVRAGLPEPEKNHVLSASYRDDALIVIVDSSMWSAHVRYREKSLLQHLVAANEKPFTKFKVRVGRP